jgi:hypothetical protein
MNQSTFSHFPYPRDFMVIALKQVKNHFKDNFKNKQVLDIPVGNGWIREPLTEYGIEVISADINKHKSDFSLVDMEKPLPFFSSILVIGFWRDYRDWKRTSRKASQKKKIKLLFKSSNSSF